MPRGEHLKCVVLFVSTEHPSRQIHRRVGRRGAQTVTECRLDGQAHYTQGIGEFLFDFPSFSNS